MYASADGQTEIVQLLLSQPGIEINWKNISIQKSFTIFKFHYFVIFKFELFHGIEIPKFSKTALILASKKGYTEIVRLLLLQPNIAINCEDI